jgi:uncharacterized protein (TIGR03083 family)
MSSIFSFDKQFVIDSIRAQRASTVRLLEDLDEAQWDIEVTPGWRVREMAAHLLTTDEASLTGKLLALGVRRVPLEVIERWNDEQVKRWADRPIPALLHGLDAWGRRLARALAIPPAKVASAPFPSPFGRVSLLWLGMLRVFDEWVHSEDVRRALSLPSDDAPDVVLPVAKLVLAGIPIQTLPLVPDDAKGTVLVGFTDAPLAPLGVDMSAHRFGTALTSADARVEAPAAALTMIAAGRDPWREAEAAGTLRIEGDRSVAESFLDVLTVA